MQSVGARPDYESGRAGGQCWKGLTAEGATSIACPFFSPCSGVYCQRSMTKKETGELEFVLENHQILVTFAVLTSLLGLFFGMGYLAGRKSVPTAPLVASDSPPTAIASGSSQA